MKPSFTTCFRLVIVKRKHIFSLEATVWNCDETQTTREKTQFVAGEWREWCEPTNILFSSFLLSRIVCAYRGAINGWVQQERKKQPYRVRCVKNFDWHLSGSFCCFIVDQLSSVSSTDLQKNWYFSREKNPVRFAHAQKKFVIKYWERRKTTKSSLPFFVKYERKNL